MGESDVFQRCIRAAQHSMAFGTTGRSEVTLWLSACQLWLAARCRAVAASIFESVEL